MGRKTSQMCESENARLIHARTRDPLHAVIEVLCAMAGKASAKREEAEGFTETLCARPSAGLQANPGQHEPS